MLLLDRLAEARIAQAVEDGELDDLPGQGQPLSLDDDRDVPVEWRAAWRILKNAGLVPREVALRRDMHELHAAIQAWAAQDGDERALSAEEREQAQRRLAFLRAHYEASMSSAGAGPVPVWADYETALLNRLAR